MSVIGVSTRDDQAGSACSLSCAVSSEIALLGRVVRHVEQRDALGALRRQELPAIRLYRAQVALPPEQRSIRRFAVFAHVRQQIHAVDDAIAGDGSAGSACITRWTLRSRLRIIAA
jgi:hypothetical protein